MNNLKKGVNMINSINFLGIIKPEFQNAGHVHLKTGPNDTFTKSKTQDCDNAFIKWAYDTNFMPQGLAEALKDENKLGSGFTNAVYEIPSNPDYVLRVRNFNISDDIDFNNYTLVNCEDKKLKGNFGQCVARIIPSEVQYPIFEILKKQKGITNSNPPSSVVYHEDGSIREGELPYEARERKEHYAKCLNILANMPQEAYDRLIDELGELDGASYRFDYYNPNNFLLDNEDAKINIIDIDKTASGFKNDLGNILWALSGIGYFDTYMSDYDGAKMDDAAREEAIKNTITIIDKYTQALKNKGAKYSREGYEFTTKLLSSLPFSFYLRSVNNEQKMQKLQEMGVLE